MKIGTLERHKDYYPAEAMDSNSCVHNGLIGNCGAACPCYEIGGCPVEDEVNEALEVANDEH